MQTYEFYGSPVIVTSGSSVIFNYWFMNGNLMEGLDVKDTIDPSRSYFLVQVDIYRDVSSAAGISMRQSMGFIQDDGVHWENDNVLDATDILAIDQKLQASIKYLEAVDNWLTINTEDINHHSIHQSYTME